jgi:nitrite reductase/ring-hydroxylating ferredoxin subunit
MLAKHARQAEMLARIGGSDSGGAMPDVFVEKTSDFAEGDRRIVFQDGLEIGVFQWQGQFYAYQNLCLHQGGPCCEGVIMHKVEDVLAPD